MSVACYQLADTGLPAFDRFVEMRREFACDHPIDLVALQDGCAPNDLVEYDVRSGRRICAPAKLGGEWLYLTSPSDEGDNLTQTLQTFFVWYVAPQTIFWNQSEILTGRLRIPDIERHFPRQPRLRSAPQGASLGRRRNDESHEATSGRFEAVVNL
jgi:hypothetical protein